jgi:transcriptional antiterminator RfaH
MTSFWAVCQTETLREGTAARFLAQAGFETYLPKIKTRQRVVPLFPSYLFVRILEHWWQVDTTIGVISLLKAGDQPARLKDDIVNAIRAKERGGIVKLPEPKRIKAGDVIRVDKGTFAGHFAIFEGMSGKERSRVLLELLGRKVLVEIPAIDLQQLA